MNTSHYHRLDPQDTKADPVEVEGLAEHCDVCRERNGKKPLSEIEKRFSASGLRADGGSGSGTIPADEAVRMLEEQEELNDELRQKVKEQAEEIAALRKALTSKKREPAEVS